MNHMTSADEATPKGIHLGPRTRRAVRAVARLVNPAVLLIAGRWWMPVVGVLRHQGRSSGRMYATPLGMRPIGDAFVMPRTFSESAAWYRNVSVSGWCEVKYLGRTHRLVAPEVIDFAAAAPAFPRYERFQFRLLGINEFLRMHRAPSTPAAPRLAGA